MNRQAKRAAAGVMLTLALSACSMFTPPDANRLLFGMTPTNELGYEVTPQGITVEARTLQLSARAGMPVTNVSGYRIEYRDNFGVLVGETSDVPQSLNITVPAGWQCDEPHPTMGCNAMSPGARPAQGVPATVAAVQNQFLNGDIIDAHILAGSPSGWYAEITFYYDNVYGEFEETYTVNIVVPN